MDLDPEAQKNMDLTDPDPQHWQNDRLFNFSCDSNGQCMVRHHFFSVGIRIQRPICMRMRTGILILAFEGVDNLAKTTTTKFTSFNGEFLPR